MEKKTIVDGREQPSQKTRHGELGGLLPVDRHRADFLNVQRTVDVFDQLRERRAARTAPGDRGGKRIGHSRKPADSPSDFDEDCLLRTHGRPPSKLATDGMYV